MCLLLLFYKNDKYTKGQCAREERYFGEDEKEFLRVSSTLTRKKPQDVGEEHSCWREHEGPKAGTRLKRPKRQKEGQCGQRTVHDGAEATGG